MTQRYLFASVLFALCGVAQAQPDAAASAPDQAVAPIQEPRIMRGTDRVVAPPKPVPALTGSASSYKFEEAPIIDVVHVFMREILKVDYVLHPPITGTVTLATRAEVSPDDAISLLETALQANGLLMARDTRGVYHVGRPEALKGIVPAPRQTGFGPLPPGYGTVIVPLQFIGAPEMASILRPMLPPEALVRVDSVRNLLVLAGTRTQAEGWLDLVSTFDVSLLKGMSVGVFPLKHATVQEVEAALRLVGAGGGAGATGGGAAPAGGSGGARAGGAGAAGAAGAAASAGLTEGNPLFGAIRVMPIERINSILVVTPRAAYLDEARRWIEKLDQPSDNGAEAQLFIYEVQNGNAKHLATVLSGIFGGQAPGGATANSGVAPGLATATGAALGMGNTQFGGIGGNVNNNSPFSSGSSARSGGLFSGGASRTTQQQGVNTAAPVVAMLGSIRVMADELNNSVLIWGTKAEYTKIAATLKRLDLPPTQVMIEASIIEVTLNDGLEYGLEWAFKDGWANTNYTGNGTLFAGGGNRDPLSRLASGFSYALKNPTGEVTAMLRALSNKTSVKMIASPTLMVLDNHTAAITVGNQTPVLTGTITSLENSNTTQNIYQYKDTGVNLVVTPSVNAGNLVTMQVDQSVTDVGAADDVTGQRSFLQRQLASKVAVRSGESIVMGGLIQDRGTQSKSGIPLLHTLPLVGNLFGTTSKDGTRTELVVVITPRVVRTDIDIREVSEELRDRMKGLRAVDALTPPPAPTTPAIPQ